MFTLRSQPRLPHACANTRTVLHDESQMLISHPEIYQTVLSIIMLIIFVQNTTNYTWMKSNFFSALR